MTQTPQTSRYEAGWAALKRIDGAVGERVVESLADIAPDFAKLLIEFPFGDIYTRPGLDLRALGYRIVEHVPTPRATHLVLAK